MRVLRLCSVFAPPSAALSGRGSRLDPVGGMQSHTGALTSVLDALGVAQDVVTAHRPGAPLCEALGERTRVFRVGVPVAWGRQCWSAPAAVLAPALARRADLVHAHLGEDVAVLPIALLAARLHALPLVVTVHTSVRHTLVAADPRTRRVKALGAPLERLACRRADAVLVLTERLRAAAVADGVPPARVHVIPSGVTPGAFAGPFADPFGDLPRPRVLFVGRLAPQKGVLTLVEAARALPPDAVTVLVGDGPERPLVERGIAAAALAGRVRLTGFVAHERIPGVLTHGDVLVLPSLYEELGSVLLEGMRAGVPIVASATGGIPELIVHERTGLLVPPGDAAALAAAVERLLANRELAARLAAAARERARDFGWERLAPRVLAVYQEVARGRRGSAPGGDSVSPCLRSPRPTDAG